MFSLPDSTQLFIVHGDYSIPIVVLSVVIAVAASYTALSLNQRMQQNSFFHRRFWLILSSFAMGLGIWSMHFIGMSAFMLPVPMKYNVFLTIISAVPAIAASYLAFYIVNRPHTKQWQYIISGGIMGIGIALMHYIGMHAMETNLSYAYRPWILAVSIMIAVLVSYAALYTFQALQIYMGHIVVKSIASILLGMAVSSMHYVGMHAVVFYTFEPMNTMHDIHLMDMSLLILIVTTGISVLLIIAGLTSLLDRYVDYRLYHFDPLTLFPNQRQFERDLYHHKTSGVLAVLHLHDLEKWNNDYGYAFGDKLIKSTSDVIRDVTGDSAKVYRIEGHRFAIFQSGKHAKNTAMKELNKIISVMKHPFYINGCDVAVDMVCAFASANEKGMVQALYSNCLAVLKHPSIHYNQEIIVYDPMIHDSNLENEMAAELDEAILKHELFLVYQPKVNTWDFTVAGMEALVRWNHHERGMIPPGKFIPVLEESGEIFKLTDWIIEEVCKQAAAFLKEGVPFGQLSINIPGAYVTSPKLLNVIQESLAKYNVDSKYIELEITETSVIENMELAIAAVNKFRDLGISVALDDFGTGLSSLSNLKQIPITTVKIDKSFIDDIPYSEKDSAVLKAIINLCASLNLKIVIEGAETKDQVNFILCLNEFPQIQGYYFSKPLGAEDAVKWLWEEKELMSGLE